MRTLTVATLALIASQSVSAENYIRCDYCGSHAMRNKALAAPYDQTYVYDRAGTNGIRRYVKEIIDEPGYYQVIIQEIPVEPNVQVDFASAKSAYDSITGGAYIQVPQPVLGSYVDTNGATIPLNGLDISWNYQARQRAAQYIAQQIAQGITNDVIETGQHFLENMNFVQNARFPDGSTWSFDVSMPVNLSDLNNQISVDLIDHSGMLGGTFIPTQPSQFAGLNVNGVMMNAMGWVRAAAGMGIPIVYGDDFPDMPNPVTTKISIVCTVDVCYVYVWHD